MLQGTSGVFWLGHEVGRCRDTLRLGAAGWKTLEFGEFGAAWKLWARAIVHIAGYCSANFGALQGYSAVGHCRDTLQLSTALISHDRGSALGERRLGTAHSEIFLGTRILCVYIVQLGTPGALSGWIFRG